jgi:hypothetical protein
MVAELFDGERQQFLIDLEAEVNLSAAGEMPCVFANIGKQPYFLAGC